MRASHRLCGRLFEGQTHPFQNRSNQRHDTIGAVEHHEPLGTGITQQALQFLEQAAHLAFVDERAKHYAPQTCGIATPAASAELAERHAFFADLFRNELNEAGAVLLHVLRNCGAACQRDKLAVQMDRGWQDRIVPSSETRCRSRPSNQAIVEFEVPKSTPTPMGPGVWCSSSMMGPALGTRVGRKS